MNVVRRRSHPLGRGLGHRIGLLWLAATFLGCGGSGGVERYDVSGTVTYQGKPVPAGMILFEPDTSRGNKGPGGSGKIEHGYYVTHLGAVGGPHRVRILGYDGVAVDTVDEGHKSEGSPLFSDYSTTVDLPQANSTQNFDVTDN